MAIGVIGRDESHSNSLDHIQSLSLLVQQFRLLITCVEWQSVQQPAHPSCSCLQT